MSLSKAIEIPLFLYAFSLPLSMSATNISLALILFTALIVFLIGKEKIFIPKSFFLILLFFTWACMTNWIIQEEILFSSIKSFAKSWNFLPYLLIPLLSPFLSGREKKIIKILIIVGCLVVLLGIFQYWGQVHFFFEGWFEKGLLVRDKRFFGFQSYPLHTAGLYTILYLFSMSQTLFLTPESSLDSGGPRKSLVFSFTTEQIFWWSASLILLLGVLLTGSRSYYLSVILSYLILLSLKGKKFLLTGIILGSALFYSIMGLEPYVKERFQTININHMDESGKQRIYMWKSALQMIQDHPLVGVGYKNWGKNLTSYAKNFPEWKRMDPAAIGHAHNSYLTIASETGLIGLAIFLFFWSLLLKEEVETINKLKKNQLGFALSLGSSSSIIAILVAGFFEHNFLTATISLSLFFLIGITRSVRKAEKEIF